MAEKKDKRVAEKKDKRVAEKDKRVAEKKDKRVAEKDKRVAEKKDMPEKKDREEKKKTLYHYTSKENADAIRKEGKIEPSKTGVFGGGKVYLTDIPPSAGKTAIARNNYDDRMRSKHREAQGAVDIPIKVTLPESQVKQEDDPAGRHIYTHMGSVKLSGSSDTSSQ